MGPLALLGGLAAAALAAGGVGALRRYNLRTIAAAEAAYPPAGEFMGPPGARIHYVCRGTGIPVVLFHGAAGTLHDFDYVIDALAAEFRVCVFDRPGHGYSDAPSPDGHGADAQARLFHDMIVEMGLEKPVFVGYSWGAALALQYAFLYPDETAALVLIGGTTHIGTAPRNPLYWILRTPYASEALISLGLVPIGRPYMAVPLRKVFAPDSTPGEYLKRARAMWVRPAPVRAMTDDFHGLAAALRELRPRYGELPVPVIILSGDRDRLVDPRRNSFALASEAPDAEMILVPGAGHGLPQARPDAVVQAIRRAAARREA
ncbi:MAG TPA: alpha/beta hydrolase [Longimicrobiales bacterium]|nr:alpha/beta hydrolase [Longimicrobiales bacterium]